MIVGRLTDAMCVEDGGRVDLHRFIHPKIEPEVAYRLARDIDLDDPAVDIESCVDAVAPAMEIIDSRYRDFRFTYTDVVADNTSAAAYVIGPWQSMRSAGDLAVRLEAGGQAVDGSTAAILDDPVNALHALLDMCRRRRIPLRAGDVVLAGAATAAIRCRPVSRVARSRRWAASPWRESHERQRSQGHRTPRDTAWALPTRQGRGRLRLRLRDQLAPAGQHVRRRRGRRDGYGRTSTSAPRRVR